MSQNNTNTNKSTNGNARKPYHKKKKTNSKPRLEEVLDAKGRDNNPNWYFLDKEVANDVCNYSFESVLGIGQKPTVPTLMTLYFNATPGNSYSITAGPDNNGSKLLPDTAPICGTDGANYAAMKLYTALSAGSGRNANYQSNDVLIAILAMSSVIEYAEFIRRAFGIAYTYNPRNRIVPKMLLQYQNINFEDFITNMADYRTRFNYIISRINQLPIPANIAFLEKAIEMYQRIYADSESSLSQLFQYVPATLWELDETSYDRGSILKTVYVGTHEKKTMDNWAYYQLSVSEDLIVTMDEHLSKLEEMITLLLDSTTLNLVYMDLIHLAEKKSFNFIHLDYLTDGYAVIPEVNNNALLQFHNLNVEAGYFYDLVDPDTPALLEATCADGTKINITPSNDVYTDVNTGRVIYNPGHRWTEKITDIVVDFPIPNPSLEDKIEANRFTHYKSNYVWTDDDWTGMSILDGFPDHYCVAMTMATDTYIPDMVPNVLVTKYKTGTVTDTVYNTTLKWWSYITKFTAFPVMPVRNTDGSLETVVGDLNYWTTIPFNKLARMNQVMIAGLFDFR